ncbi:hypothetical protein Nepgr_011272 [Nepenthes gracilis]|uniref:Uncharacterized protein n=1 Tax=Nepenthes gracilis TaxID=150966 RepID=A0AAD3SF01_NEPGR|nr:hypothetical protein Nepgr_011272 [Nepenthes gracilis]
MMLPHWHSEGGWRASIVLILHRFSRFLLPSISGTTRGQLLRLQKHSTHRILRRVMWKRRQESTSNLESEEVSTAEKKAEVEGLLQENAIFSTQGCWPAWLKGCCFLHLTVSTLVSAQTVQRVTVKSRFGVKSILLGMQPCQQPPSRPNEACNKTAACNEQ